MEKVLEYTLYFFMYSAFGWCLESTYCSILNKKWTNRGFLFGPMCPLYGTGAVSMLLALTWCKDYWYLVFVLGMIVCDVVEYLTSVIMEKLFHARWWDYSVNMKYHINGRVCLSHTFYWGVGAMSLIYFIHPYGAGKLYSLIPESWRLNILLGILIIFIPDLIYAIRNAVDIKNVMDKFGSLKESFAKYKAQLSENIESKKTTIQIAINEQFETTKFGEHISMLEEKVSQRKREKKDKSKRNRLFDNYPNLNRRANQQLDELKTTLSQIFNFKDDDK